QLTDEVIQKYQPTSEEVDSILAGEKQPHFISIASGEGGGGKSTVTVNLAMSLMRLGKEVGIIDADIYGFSVPDMMGIENIPAVRGEKIIPVERFGIIVISMGYFVLYKSSIIWIESMLGIMLKK